MNKIKRKCWLDTFHSDMAVIYMGWKQNAHYKVNILVSFFSSLIPLLAIYWLWKAIYAHELLKVTMYYPVTAMITYAMGAYLLNILISSFGIEWEISDHIFEGKLTYYLMYPMKYMKYCFLCFTSEKLFSLFLRIPAIFIVLFGIKGLLPLPPVSYLSLFLIAACFSYVLSYLFSFMISMSAFVWTDVTGFFYLGNIILTFCSGLLFPLHLLGSDIVPFLKWTPFYYIIYFPMQILIKAVSLTDIGWGLLNQSCWIAVFYVLASFLFQLGVNKYEGYGS